MRDSSTVLHGLVHVVHGPSVMHSATQSSLLWTSHEYRTSHVCRAAGLALAEFGWSDVARTPRHAALVEVKSGSLLPHANVLSGCRDNATYMHH